MKGIVLLSAILAAGVLSFSCASKTVLIEKPPSPETLAREAPALAKEAWEKEWEDTLRKAKKEGEVLVYTSIGGETRDELIKAFTRKFGIDLEWTAARGSDITQKLLTEQRAGIHLVDIYIGGTTTIANVVKPSGILAPLEPAFILPEVLDPRFWPDGKLPFFDKDRMGLSMARPVTPRLAVNTNLVNEGEIKSFRDLLAPKWKGKVIMNDPTTIGSGLGWFSFMVEKLGEDYMRQLARQEPVLLRDERLQIEWLARGRYHVLIAPKTDSLVEFMKAGAPITRLKTLEGDGVSPGAANLSRLKNPAHPAAQKLFVNWILTKEAQTYFSKTRMAPSTRLDVSTEGLDPVRIPQIGVEYYNDTEEDILKQPQFQELAREIFGPLMK